MSFSRTGECAFGSAINSKCVEPDNPSRSTQVFFPYLLPRHPPHESSPQSPVS
uniref:Uncharacterized protein n=1 Tax=Arundo donax TaxID=35708 RepID=A0A0A8YWT9_ARUDO